MYYSLIFFIFVTSNKKDYIMERKNFENDVETQIFELTDGRTFHFNKTNDGVNTQFITFSHPQYNQCIVSATFFSEMSLSVMCDTNVLSVEESNVGIAFIPAHEMGEDVLEIILREIKKILK